MRKIKNAGKQHFLLHQNVFHPIKDIFTQFFHILISICKLRQLGKFYLFCQPFSKQTLVFSCLLSKSFESTVRKGEIACNRQRLLFPQCFLPFWRTFHYFHQIQNSRLLTLSVWKSLIFVIWDKVEWLIKIKQVNIHQLFTTWQQFKFG